MPQSGVSVDRVRESRDDALAYAQARERASRARALEESRAQRPRNLALVRPSPTDAAPKPVPAPAAAPERRTITITGRGAERHYPSTYSRRRPQRPVHHRPGFRPDRAAMWAVMLGFLLVLVAATSSHAAIRSHASPSSHVSPRSHAVVTTRTWHHR